MRIIKFDTIPGYPVKVSGEVYHREEIESIFGTVFEDGVSKEGLVTHLFLDASNSYADTAVRVVVQGRHVGFLTAKDAVKYRKGLNHLRLADVIGQCTARIHGGYLKLTGEWADYSVTLDIDLDHLTIYNPPPKRD